MLSSTLSFLCEPQPAAVPAVYHRAYHAPPPPPAYFGCCHCSGHPTSSPYAFDPQYEHYRHPHPHGHCEPYHYHHHRRQQRAVEQYHPHTQRAVVARSEELAYVDQMQRSLALLKESVKKLSVPPATSSSSPSAVSGKLATKQNLTAAAAQATLVLEAVAAASSSSSSPPQLPVSTLFKTIRKQRSQPRHHCCECGAAKTTQWRNSPTGKNRKRKEIEIAEDLKQESGEQQQQAQPASGGEVGLSVTNKDDNHGNRRSSIYSLLN